MRRSLRFPVEGAVATSVPPATRRPKGWLSDAIVTFLTNHGPATAHAVGIGLRRRYPKLLGSAVFIAMKKLHGRGVVHRVECTKTYLLTVERDPIDLLCGACGAHAQAVDEELGDLVRANSHRDGFAARRLVLEVIGVCPSCKEAQLASTQLPHSPRTSTTGRSGR